MCIQHEKQVKDGRCLKSLTVCLGFFLSTLLQKKQDFCKKGRWFMVLWALFCFFKENAFNDKYGQKH